MILNQIYEADFQDFSYGFRAAPGGKETAKAWMRMRASEIAAELSGVTFESNQSPSI
jgi:hypothetical protein